MIWRLAAIEMIGDEGLDSRMKGIGGNGDCEGIILHSPSALPDVTLQKVDIRCNLGPGAESPTRLLRGQGCDGRYRRQTAQHLEAAL